MGLFLQKVNIIRDYLEDTNQGRCFWPKVIWSQYASSLYELKDPGNETQALNCLSAMVLNTLQLAPQSLTYMSRIRNQSVFEFCAIPQVMAIATLALLFRNYDVYRKVVKIRKGETLDVSIG
jgi:farnesyl-diphosphate farnesyltransferase